MQRSRKGESEDRDEGHAQDQAHINEPVPVQQVRCQETQLHRDLLNNVRGHRRHARRAQVAAEERVDVPDTDQRVPVDRAVIRRNRVHGEELPVGFLRRAGVDNHTDDLQAAQYFLQDALRWMLVRNMVLRVKIWKKIRDLFLFFIKKFTKFF